MTTVNADIDTIASEPQALTLESGLPVQVLRLKTRQMMRLMKVLTRGGGDAIGDLNFSEDMSQSEFAGQIIGSMVFSIPEAEDETIDFVRSMIEPANLVSGSSKQAKEKNEAAWGVLDAEMANPDLNDLVSIIEAVVTIEAPHLVALGKRLQALFQMQRRVASVKQPKSA